MDRTVVPGGEVSRTGKGIAGRAVRALRPTRKRALIGAAAVAGVIGTLYLTAALFFTVATGQGDSMHPAIDHGDLLVARTLWASPQLGDIVILEKDIFPGTLLAKRITGAPGDTVRPQNGEPPRVLGPGEYWVTSSANRYIGHERTIDSNDFGPVSREEITGVVVWRSGILKWGEPERRPWGAYRDEKGRLAPAP